jgi:LPXTG-motif cell wall-anchored protein
VGAVLVSAEQTNAILPVDTRPLVMAHWVNVVAATRPIAALMFAIGDSFGGWGPLIGLPAIVLFALFGAYRRRKQ